MIEPHIMQQWLTQTGCARNTAATYHVGSMWFQIHTLLFFAFAGSWQYDSWSSDSCSECHASAHHQCETELQHRSVLLGSWSRSWWTCVTEGCATGGICNAPARSHYGKGKTVTVRAKFVTVRAKLWRWGQNCNCKITLHCERACAGQAMTAWRWW